MNAAAPEVMALSTRDHVKPALKQLHWLPVEQRISYKLCLLMHYIYTSQAPQYLSNCLYDLFIREQVQTQIVWHGWLHTAENMHQVWRTWFPLLREQVQTQIVWHGCILPRTCTKFGERGFHYSGPAAWNTLPSDLHDITDTNVFKKRLKTVMFDRAYWLTTVVVRRSWTVCRAAPYKSLIVLYCWLYFVCGRHCIAFL